MVKFFLIGKMPVGGFNHDRNVLKLQ